MRVYHLTNATHAVSNIALRRIKISRFADLNDPFELIGADLKNRDERRRFRALRNELHEKYGVLCFSKSWSNPVLWSHYADKHRGACLGFDVSDDLLLPVIYTRRPLKLRFASKNARYLMLAKYSGWAYEDEIRRVVQLGSITDEGGMSFMPFSSDLRLKEVILGPRCTLPVKTISELVAQLNREIEIKIARLAFSSFRVVENRIATQRARSAA